MPAGPTLVEADAEDATIALPVTRNVTTTRGSLKRKANENAEEEARNRKLVRPNGAAKPPSGPSRKPLSTSMTKPPSKPLPLTKPKGPTLTTSARANQLADLTRDLSEARSEVRDLKHALNGVKSELEEEKRARSLREYDIESDVRRAEQRVEELEADLATERKELEHTRDRETWLKADLDFMRGTLGKREEKIAEVEAELQKKTAEIEALKQEVVDGERIRRELHNTIQDLKGNIRVFARVRPPLNESDLADMEYDKDKRSLKVVSVSESATGAARRDIHNFTFDRIFRPEAQQAEVWSEVEGVVQSCVDGYNVCVFAYGQTGSGKSWTMEGGDTPETRGMIPRAVDATFKVTEDLKMKGWHYTLEGQYLEIYNESIVDLLTMNPLPASSYTIRHDAPTRSTTVVNMSTVPLACEDDVNKMLANAKRRRTVASTGMNEQSSRSHSVFRLHLTGTNESSGEVCEGWLNLVDLAGSERLAVLNHGGDRLKETQNINKSLSALGDVISALGDAGGQTARLPPVSEDGKPPSRPPSRGERPPSRTGPPAEKHIPYRNSKLTYLLQYSLGGSSKTLMILNLSPTIGHLGESLNSLRFATKVNNTTVGAAKKMR
ncbi:kinesin-domain-containing protein [Cylindrobasidium torrendii FP15055 ss-10]|uniref:Kinesin-domain-containing protein n=1 Tax=Cylindrobasidium torrendii FP15055 ss-10 TaxID=1314674 RepID=A0A0D7BJ29_9AGAR|nr:kinesin-domain-containing protein [Cylindrobasidium torrendii FP15055 ss-10]